MIAPGPTNFNLGPGRPAGSSRDGDRASPRRTRRSSDLACIALALPGPPDTCARSSPVSLSSRRAPGLLASRGIMSDVLASPLDVSFADDVMAKTRDIVISTVVLTERYACMQ